MALASETRARHRAAPRQGGEGDGALTRVIPAVTDEPEPEKPEPKPDEPAPEPAPEPVRTRVAFIDIGRAIAALLVVYAHFDLLFLRQNYNQSTWFTDLVDNGLGAPLALSDQTIGAVAVPFFFMVSGFVVTPIAMKLGGLKFGTNRFFRVYPPVIVAVLLAAGAFWIGLRPLTTGHPAKSIGELLINLSLVNFIQAPTAAFVGVAWTLAVEVMFYLLLVAVVPLLRRMPWLALFVELDLVLVLLCTHGVGGPNWHAFVANVVYLTTPIMGQIIWAAWTKRIPPWLAGLYLLACWALFVWSGHLTIDQDYLPRPTPVGYALLLFLLGLFAERYLKQRRVWTELSERSYSIYLLHGVIAFPVMHLVVKSVPVWLTVLIGLVVLAVGVELNFRLVERPSHNLGRMLARRLGAPKPEPEPEPTDDEEIEDEFADDFDDGFDNGFDDPDEKFGDKFDAFAEQPEPRRPRRDENPTSPVHDEPPSRPLLDHPSRPLPPRPMPPRNPVGQPVNPGSQPLNRGSQPANPGGPASQPVNPGSQPMRAPRPPARTPARGVGKPLPGQSGQPGPPPAGRPESNLTWTRPGSDNGTSGNTKPDNQNGASLESPGNPARRATPHRAEASEQRTDLIPKVSRNGSARQRIE